MDWGLYFAILGCFILAIVATTAMIRIFFFGIGGSTDDDEIAEALLLYNHPVTANELRLRHPLASSNTQSRRDSDHWASQLRENDDGKRL